MNKENDEPWNAVEIEKWENDIWLRRHAMGYSLYKNKEERSAARKLMKKMEKEEDKDHEN